MDAHFNAYKAKYDLLDAHIFAIRRGQYVKSMDIFINLDDIIHNLHRPFIENEARLGGILAAKYLASNIANLVGHYKMWATKAKIKARIFCIYTTTLHGFKNAVWLPNYRDHYTCISDPNSEKFFFVNDAVNKGVSVAHSICDYVSDVFMIDSRYLEPSIIPWMLKQAKIANYDWSMVISRDHYDLQYAYRDKWIFVSSKGENTRIVGRDNLWTYLGDREKVTDIGRCAALYHHNLLPLALSVTGCKYRTIPRLARIGWKTLFKYLIEITKKDTQSSQIITSRFLELLEEKGIPYTQIERNLNCVSIDTQVSVINEIDRASIMDQLKFVTDHDSLKTINDIYFAECPINIPFLIASYVPPTPFS